MFYKTIGVKAGLMWLLSICLVVPACTSTRSTEAARGSIAHSDTMHPVFETPTTHVDLEQIPKGHGLLVEGHSSYNLKKALGNWVYEAGDGRDNPLFVYFGTKDEAALSEHLTNIHQYIMPILLDKIRQSAIFYIKWQGDYKLVFNVSALEFGSTLPNKREKFTALCFLYVDVSLIQLSTNKVIKGPRPNLVVVGERSTSGDLSAIQPLYEKVAQEIIIIMNSDLWLNKL